MDKIQRARKIAAIAIATARAIFRSGRAWGTAKTRVRTARRPPVTAGGPTGPVAGIAVGAAGAWFLDPQNGGRRRHVTFDRARALLRRGAAEGERRARRAAGTAKGAIYEAAGAAGDGADELPDAELANKVRTEIEAPPPDSEYAQIAQIRAGAR